MKSRHVSAPKRISSRGRIAPASNTGSAHAFAPSRTIRSVAIVSSEKSGRSTRFGGAPAMPGIVRFL